MKCFAFFSPKKNVEGINAIAELFLFKNSAKQYSTYCINYSFRNTDRFAFLLMVKFLYSMYYINAANPQNITKTKLD